MTRICFNFFVLMVAFQITLLNGAEVFNPNTTALIIVDVQNDFCAGGSLAVPHADDVIPVINQLRAKFTFSKVIFTMDWHPPGHVSFYERFSDQVKFPGAILYEDYSFDLGDGRGQRTQRLWPVHCVQNSSGAALRIGLEFLPTDIIVFKGTNPNVDSYSGFLDNDGISETELDRILRNSGIQKIVITGLALEYCVGQTALDGIKKGYKVVILEDACGFFGNRDTTTMKNRLATAGVKVMSSHSYGHGTRLEVFQGLILMSIALDFQSC